MYGSRGVSTTIRSGFTTSFFNFSGSPLKGVKSGASTVPQCDNSKGVSG